MLGMLGSRHLICLNALKQTQEYAKLRNPFCVNDLHRQSALLDRIQVGAYITALILLTSRCTSEAKKLQSKVHVRPIPSAY